MSHALRRSVVLVLILLAAMTAASAADPAYDPPLAKASDEAQKAIKQFQVPAGIETKVWAAEPLLANPVCFTFDEKGRCFVAETFRLHHGVTDNRQHMNWLDDDIACQTVADRVAMHRKWAKDKFAATYEKEHDRVRMVWDSTGKGQADQSSVFADGFHSAASGIGSGLLARHGNVYYTCIPDLWLLKDTDGDHKAEVRESLSTGYGVHVAFLGHDMHGLRMGPDGRLYFSIGDRGLNVTSKDGMHLFNPNSGAVLRCDPDGSNLEVVAIGLRNPQELAFDEFGNLFTVDNNSDSGDRARLVQIVQGGDTGWRMSYQYGTSMGNRGPFNAEKIWHLPNPDQPAYIVPPLAHITDGPSGFCYNPGAAALPEKYARHFFICDFRGNNSGSGVWSFALKPKGASFEPSPPEHFVWSILATDCDFGPDGGFYISDWVQGWEQTQKGRIYRFADPEADKKPIVAEVKKLLAEGFDKRSNDELTKLLQHPDMRVRQEAQFALADKGPEVIPLLAKIAKRQAKDTGERLARFHALWALGQIARRSHDESTLPPIVACAGDHDSEARAQAANVLGDIDGLLGAVALEPLSNLMKDSEPRVQYFAAQSLGKVCAHLDEKAQAVAGEELRKLAADNADADLFIRQAVAIALSRLNATEVMRGAEDKSASVRMVSLLGLRRRHKSPAIASFLEDSDPRLVLEAARAIHDLPIDAAMPFLAKMIKDPKQPEPLLYRVLNANFRLGAAENAAAVAKFAASADAPAKLRVEAVKMLGDWAKPGPRDRLIGDTRPLPMRDPKIAIDAMRSQLGGIFAGPDGLRRQAVTVAAKLGIKEVAVTLRQMAIDEKQPVGSRVAALRALHSMNDPAEGPITAASLHSKAPAIRAEALRNFCLRQPDAAVMWLGDVEKSGSIEEQQAACSILVELKRADYDAFLGAWLDKMLEGKVRPEIKLDLLEAARARGTKLLLARVEQFEKSRAANDPLAKYRECLEGGDAERGRDLFLNKTELSCVRCHQLNKVGGEVGPELAGIGGKQKRDYLLESIVTPDKQIAKGFDTVVLELKKGTTVTGVFKSETADEVKLVTAEGKALTVKKSDIEERRRGKSAMPEDLVQKMSKRDLRDLVEFLAGLK